VRHAPAEGIADRWQVRQEAVLADLGKPDDALAKIRTKRSVLSVSRLPT
jgi:hypothetical protein